MTLTLALSLTLTLALALIQGTSGAWMPVRGTFVTQGTHPPGE